MNPLSLLTVTEEKTPNLKTEHDFKFKQEQSLQTILLSFSLKNSLMIQLLMFEIQGKLRTMEEKK